MHNKIKNVREIINKKKLNGYIVPRSDEWQGEYVAAYAERLKWLTGFDGSYGFAVILQEKAALFVDGRYTIQAQNQVDRDVFDVLQIPDNRISEWIKDNLSDEGKIGFDPWLFSRSWVERMEKSLSGSKISIIPVLDNLVDLVWQDKPYLSNFPVRIYPHEFAGRNVDEKISLIADKLAERNCDSFMITEADSIAWLFNLRGNDVSHTPYILARAIIHADRKATLIIHPSRVSDGMRAHVGKKVIFSHPDELTELLRHTADNKKRIGVDYEACPYALYMLLKDAHTEIINMDDPCALVKACKTASEIAGMKDAHIYDAIALTKFFYWLETTGIKEDVNEYIAGKKLHEFRTQHSAYRDDSFDAIVGFNSNGAIVHYRAEHNTSLSIKGDGLLLVDSGGQYENGTTDITRTIAIGQPTNEMKDRYTRVLKGHIALAKARFPKGTSGRQLDVLARSFLWDAGLDYSHGTGHGVGTYLSVHEGPQSISPRGKDTPLECGMVISNEPGYYKENEYGIRFENLVLVTEDTKPEDSQPMLCFETLSLFPVDLTLLDKKLLTAQDIDWINTYHARIRKTLLSLLDKTLADWLKVKTKTVKKGLLL